MKLLFLKFAMFLHEIVQNVEPQTWVGDAANRAAIGRGKKVTAKKNCSCERRNSSSDIEPSLSASRYGLFSRPD